jgi:AraC family transcriptional regulator of adaptative response / DNA-3-methyladenine glycosylase II
MELDTQVCYEALLTHDPRFDGVFFVGVSSTGIYCRTVCPARTPHRDNCTFHPSAAAAEKAGFRPCLRCRPELAPGNAHVDSVGRLAAEAASRIEDGALTEGTVSELAASLGVSDRHLRRVLESELGVTPVELAQTHRLLLAKRLLTDTALPVTDVAMASGFSSLRRFNALFQERYRLSPSALRKGRPEVTGPAQTLSCEVAYRPPLDWGSLLGFLGDRADRGVEARVGDRYLRTAAWGRHRGWLAVKPRSGKHALRVEMASSLAPALLPVLTRVKRLFDLSAEPLRIAAHLGPLAERHPGLRVPGAFDGFSVAVRAILGQQVSVRAATTLMGRLVTAFGEPVETPFEELTHLPPTPERLAAAEESELCALGIVAARARAIRALAEAVASRRVTLEPGVDLEETLARLQELPGIGGWTAQYVALRALSWPDAFMPTDLGVKRALGTENPKEALRLAEPWRPWRSYAMMHLWKRGQEVL